MLNNICIGLFSASTKLQESLEVLEKKRKQVIFIYSVTNNNVNEQGQSLFDFFPLQFEMSMGSLKDTLAGQKGLRVKTFFHHILLSLIMEFFPRCLHPATFSYV
jgi:hypothetical protein